MAKKKKKSSAGGPPAKLSDKGYLTSGRARSLPVYKCYANEGWEDIGMTHIYVLRQHANTNLTVGIFLIDLFCAGAKDSFYLFNQPLQEVEEKLETSPIPLEEISYELAHNIIYGAVAFAADYGIEPDPGFKVTQYILEEDTDDIELIDIDFGVNGKPVLYINPDSGPRVDYYLRQLEKHAGPGNYNVVKGYHEGYGADDDFDEDDEDDYYQYPDEWDEDEWEDFIDETEPEQLKDYPVVAFHMYDKLAETPTHPSQMLSADAEEVVVEMNLSYEPLPHTNSAEELKAAEELSKHETKTKTSPASLNKCREITLEAIEKWPLNPTFGNYLINSYIWLLDETKREEEVTQLYQKFPDNLYVKVLYAQQLLNQNKPDEVPAIFNNQYQLKGVYPDRDTFHVSELVAFSFVMADYYFQEGDLHSANLYLKLIGQVEIPEDAPIHFNTMAKVRDAIIKEMEPVLREAKQDEMKKIQLVAKVAELS